MKRPRSRFANTIGANVCIIIGAISAVVGLVAGIVNAMVVAQIGFLFTPLILVGVVGLYINGLMKKIDLRLIDIQMTLQYGRPRPDEPETPVAGTTSELKGRFGKPTEPVTVEKMNEAMAQKASE